MCFDLEQAVCQEWRTYCLQVNEEARRKPELPQLLADATTPSLVFSHWFPEPGMQPGRHRSRQA
jgi:hypothetical protein